MMRANVFVSSVAQRWLASTFEFSITSDNFFLLIFSVQHGNLLLWSWVTAVCPCHVLEGLVSFQPLFICSSWLKGRSRGNTVFFS